MSAPVLPPMLARMPEPAPIVIGDAARKRLTSLLERQHRAVDRYWTLRSDAADLSQLVEAFKWRDMADETWQRFHEYAAGVAGVNGSDATIEAVNEIRRQLTTTTTEQQ